MKICRSSKARLSINTAAVMVTLAFVSVSCTTDVGISTSGTTAPSESSVTVPAPDTTMPKVLTRGDLEDLLPDADDIGPDYEQIRDVEDDDDVNDPFTAALEKSCPEFAELENDDDGDDDGVEREFSTDDDRSIDVELSIARNPTPDLDELEKTLAALKKCDEVKFKSDGFDYKVELSGKRDDNYGDAAAQLKMRVTMTGGGLAKPVEFDSTIYSAQVGKLAVQVTATSGLTDKQIKVRADMNALTDVMDLMVTRAEDAQ